eukprot:6479848-Amphidinium_carterae.1
MAISQVNTLSISSLQEKARARTKDPIHSTKATARAKASHQSLAGPEAEQVIHQISAAGKVQYIS